MEFEADAFISYAHLDNQQLVEGRQGWVANLQRALSIRVGQMLGKDAHVWWDRKLQGNDAFDAALVARLQKVAALVTVVTPRYVLSDWTRKELAEFCKAAETTGGLRVHEKTRLFKVLKTRVPEDQHPPELQAVLGYEFYKIDPATGKIRELDEIFGQDAQRDFWIKLDDLAHDLSALIQSLDDDEPSAAAAPREAAPPPGPAVKAVYLATTTSDRQEDREAVRRDLEQHGYLVLPNRPLPATAPEIEQIIRSDLERSRLSVHIVGATYGLVPEGGQRSIVEMQNELAVARMAAGGFARLVWIPPGVQPSDDRQRAVIEALRMDPRPQRGSDVVEKPLEDLRTLLKTWLEEGGPADAAAEPAHAEGAHSRYIYLIYDQRDVEAVAPWIDFLFKDFEVIRSVFDKDESANRSYHQASLQKCDAVAIFYGAGNESWLRRKLREVQKSAGYGRTGPQPPVGIVLIPPRTSEKDQFRTQDALLIPQWDGVAPAPWTDLFTRINQERSGRRDSVG
jgi:uncharacterized coiled-coil protein SlyX